MEVASRWLGENPALVRVDVVELGSRAVLHSLTPGAGRIEGGAAVRSAAAQAGPMPRAARRCA